MSREARQPPKFVPTLTHMVQPATAKVEPAPVTSAAMPAAFAELLKDWPSLGEPGTSAEPTPVSAPPGHDESDQEALAERQAERIAQRAEALVLQRLPALMAGLVSQAVRDAMTEVEATKPESSSADSI